MTPGTQLVFLSGKGEHDDAWPGREHPGELAAGSSPCLLLNGHRAIEQIPQQPKQADAKKERNTSFLLSVWASVLRNLRIAVFRGQGALVGVKHIFSFSDVCHFVHKVVCGRVSWLSDFVPESRTSPGGERFSVKC